MSSQSSSGSAACNGPPARCAWIYTATDGFQAQIGKTSQGFKRLPPVKLFKLVNSENFYKVPTAPPHLFYHAQLLHYGLTPAQDVPAAVAILKAAFVRAGKPKKLKPPTSVYNVKQALKVEYWERIKLVKTGRTAEIRVELKELERKQAALKKEMRSLENHTESPERKQRHISISSSPPSQRGSANATVSAVEETKPIVRKRKALDNTIEESIKDGQITKKVRSSEKRDVAILPLPSQKISTQPSSTKPPATKPSATQLSSTKDKLAALLYGKWKVHRKSSTIDLTSWIGIGKHFAKQVGSQGHGQASAANITAYVGRIEMSDFRAAFHADQLARNTSMVGDILRVSFTWRRDLCDAQFEGVEGRLIIDFDGNNLEGTILHAGFPKPIFFQGYHRTPFTTATDSSNVGAWWLRYKELKRETPAKGKDEWVINVARPSYTSYY